MKNFDFRLAAAIHDLKFLTTYGYQTRLHVHEELNLIDLQVYYNSKSDLMFIIHNVKCYSELQEYKDIKWSLLRY